MSTQVKHQLWRLVKSMTKSEKRNFKLFATRAGGTGQSKFVQLFDLLDRAAGLDDEAVKSRMKLSAGKYSNLKRHLYQQILTSLRLVHIDKEIDIELREQIDFSRILYGKGHYLDALRLLERAKAKAVEHNQDILHLEIVEFQKLIEARHVTMSRRVVNKMDLLLNESAERSYLILNTSELLNMNIQIHGRYIEYGHSRTPREVVQSEAFWSRIQTVRVDRQTTAGTFHQKINRFQASMWYHYIQLDFRSALEAAENAATLFTISRQMTVKDPDLYLRCLYYVTVFSYLLGDTHTLRRYRSRMADMLDDPNLPLNENSHRIGAVYRKLSRYNELFVLRRYENAYAFSRRIAEDFADDIFNPNEHRWGLFLYKSAAAAFVVGEYSKAIDDLNDIINGKAGIHRQDLLINTRMLHALCNYELGHFSLVEYHMTGLARLLRRSREAAEVHRLTVTALRRLINAPSSERGPIYEALWADIQPLRGRPFEHKALIYLDVGFWLALHHPNPAPAAAPAQ